MAVKWTGASRLAILLCGVSVMVIAARSYAFNPPLLLSLEGAQAQIPMPWNQPPPEFREMERQGFHAGVQAAIKDYNHHREANAERRKEYRKPPVQRSFVEDYRKGFRRGYDDAMRHMEQSAGRHS
jgi:hypothetical protein